MYKEIRIMDIMEFEELQKVTGNTNKKENKHLAAVKTLIGMAFLWVIPLWVIGPAELWNDTNVIQKIILVFVMVMYVIGLLSNLAAYIFTRKDK